MFEQLNVIQDETCDSNLNWIKKNKGFKYRLLPNKLQEEYLSKACGCKRKLYNEYVARMIKKLESTNFENGKITYSKLGLPSPSKLKKEFEFMKEVDSLVFCNAEIAFKNAITKYNDNAYKKQYTKSALKKQKTIGRKLTFKDLKGLPSFKSKKDGYDSFTTNNQNTVSGDTIKVEGNYIKIPKLKSPIKFVKHRELPSDGVIKNITISKDSKGKFYISINVEYYVLDKKVTVYKNKVVGLDYSQSDFYYSSDDKIANYPKFYKKLEERLIKEQRKLSSKKFGGYNWLRQKKVVNRLQTKIANQRKDWLHKESYRLAEKYDAVIVEDLDLRNLAQCLSLGKNVHDNGFGMFRDMLKYKLEDRGKQFIKVDKWFASSKICSSCGHKHDELKLSDRTFVCPNCNLTINRDYNASLNIKAEGLRILELA